MTNKPSKHQLEILGRMEYYQCTLAKTSMGKIFLENPPFYTDILRSTFLALLNSGCIEYPPNRSIDTSNSKGISRYGLTEKGLELTKDIEPQARYNGNAY